jgi:hypothetical protein
MFKKCSLLFLIFQGENGVNHNIELHKDIIDYGKQKINEFVKTSVHFDDFDFCTYLYST